MHHRYDSINIPIEVLRSFIAVLESGGFTKAAARLKLTQPAISSQIKRLQQLVGGEVFAKDSNSLVLTERGEIVSKYARRILAFNDQIMLLAGGGKDQRRLRVGIPNVFSSTLSRIWHASQSMSQSEPVQFVCDSSQALTRKLIGGYLDVAFILTPVPPQLKPQSIWQEKLGWVCSPDFSLEANAAVPIQSWPDTTSDIVALNACEEQGLSYSIVFEASDLMSHVAAAKCGAGLIVLPERVVPSELSIARDRHLPELPQMTAGVYLHEDAEAARLSPIVNCLNSVLVPTA